MPIRCIGRYSPCQSWNGGTLLQEYPSVLEAARLTGLPSKSLLVCCRQQIPCEPGGPRWKFAQEGFKTERPRDERKRVVCVWSGDLCVAKFATRAKAAKFAGLTKSDVEKVLSGRVREAAGYRFTYQKPEGEE